MEKISQSRVNILLMTLFRKSFIHKDGKIIKTLVLLNEQPTSLKSLTTINPDILKY